MLNNRFAVLTGHLNDYPLSDLIGVLRHQRKTGRLMIEYAKGPAIFYFNDGDLVDAQLGDLVGLQAICVAVGQPPASFNFNSLVRPSRRSIENSLQRVVSELLGCWDENSLQIDTVAAAETDAHSLAPSPSGNVLVAGAPGPLALPGLVAQEPSINYSRTMLASVAVALILLGLSMGVALTSEFGSTAASTPNPLSTVEGKASQSDESVRPEITPEATKSGSERGNATRRERSNPRNAGMAQAQRQSANGPSDSKKTDDVAEGSRVSSSATGVNTPHADDVRTENTPAVKSIKVVMQIQNGRVLRAAVSKSQAGMESYEALALRIARQRRYPAQTVGQETVTIRVNPE